MGVKMYEDAIARLMERAEKETSPSTVTWAIFSCAAAYLRESSNLKRTWILPEEPRDIDALQIVNEPGIRLVRDEDFPDKWRSEELFNLSRRYSWLEVLSIFGEVEEARCSDA